MSYVMYDDDGNEVEVIADAPISFRGARRTVSGDFVLTFLAEHHNIEKFRDLMFYPVGEALHFFVLKSDDERAKKRAIRMARANQPGSARAQQLDTNLDWHEEQQ